MTPRNITLPFIKLKGSPQEIGYQHGRLLGDRVRACFDFYTQKLFKQPKFDFKSHGEAYLEVIHHYSPNYGIEIEALAKGAGLEPWKIGVLNARTEIFLEANAELINECTSLYFRENGLLGQNWDWMMACESMIALLEIERQDGHRILMMTEPGIIGKIGFNSAGLGVCLNILLGQEGTVAVPIHILLRTVLDACSLEEARSLLSEALHVTFSNLLIADANGDCLDLEFNGRGMRQVSYDSRVPIHTNHYLSEDVNDPDNVHIIDSQTRLTRANMMCRELKDHTIVEMKRILLDRENGERAICKPSQPIWDLYHGTICTLIMDLPKRTMHITKGNPYRAGFEEHRLA